MPISIFDMPIAELQRYSRGEALTARKMNQAVDALNRISGGCSPPRQSIPATGVSRGTGSIIQVRFKSTDEGLLICRAYDLETETEGTEDVKVMMPWTLRRSRFDGLTVNSINYVYTTDVERTATLMSDTNLPKEIQIIDPPYEVDDIIYAAVLTGLDADKTITAVDLNADARCWTRAAS